MTVEAMTASAHLPESPAAVADDGKALEVARNESKQTTFSYHSGQSDTEPERSSRQGSKHSANSRPGGTVALAPLKGSVYDLEQARGFAFRRHMAMLTKANLKLAADDVQNPAKPGTDAFCKLLHRRYGSVAAAWRLSLDPDQKGRLSFSEFVNVSRSIGYCCNLKLLWNQLDADKSGFITLNELDPEAAQALDSFRNLLIKKFGTTLRAWRAMDVDKNDRLDVHELEQRCKEFGYEGNARKLFFYLKTDVSRSFLTLADIDPQAFIARMRGDHNMLLAKTHVNLTQVKSTPTLVSPAGSGTTPSGFGLVASQSHPTLRAGYPSPSGSHGPPTLESDFSDGGYGGLRSPSGSPNAETTNSKWTKQQSLDLIANRRMRREKQAQADVGVKTVDGLKRLLLVRYGSYYSAWRQALDFDGNERLSFGEFCSALRELGFVGNAKSAWKALDTDQDGFIELSDFDEKTAKEMSTYRSLVREKYGHMLAGWLQGLSKDGNTPVDEKTFIRHCEDIEYPYDKAILFQNLKNDNSRRYMTLADYDFAASAAFLRGDVGMVSEASGSTVTKRPPTELDFNERNESSFRMRWNRVQSKMQRADLMENMEKDREASMAASDFPSFKKLLLRKYGTMTAAWKHALDPDGNGRLSFGEFCESLRKLGYCGSKKHLWIEMDSEKTGFITLDKLDKKAHEFIESLRKLMTEKYGTWLKLWQALDNNRNGRVDEDEFLEAMPVLGYQLDAKYLFKLLLDRPGSTFLVMSDLDPSAASEYYRGPDVDKRRELEKLSIKEKDKLKGASSLESLKKTLIAKYGTITSAWKHVLDADGNGRLSFVEFCQALQSVGYIGNIKEIFMHLDADGSGFISLDELDPKAAEATTKFRELVIAKYGNFLTAWKAFDVDGSGAIDRDEFVARVKELGYEGNAKMLFKYYLDKPGCKTLQLGDLDAEAGREKFRNQQRMETKAHRNALAAQQEERRKADVGMSDVKGLKAGLVKKFGTITAAWKHHLDTGRNGRISFVEFCNAMREIGFNSSLKSLWKELDSDGSGFITLDELDPDANRAMKEFRKLVIEKHGSFLAAWKVFDSNGSNTLDLDEFIQECSKLGYSGDAKKLYKYFLDKPGCKFLTLNDLDQEAAREEYRDPNRLNARAKRDSIKANWDAAKAKDTGAASLSSFKRLLIKKYGTITAAWQHALDSDGNGKLSFVEFSQSARALAYTGSVKELWKELDKDGGGIITLDELDPKTHQVITEFKTFIKSTFTGYKEAWKAMDSTRKMVVYEEDFNAFCAAHGFQNKPELFKNLLDKPGAKSIKEDIFQSPHFTQFD